MAGQLSRTVSLIAPTHWESERCTTMLSKPTDVRPFTVDVPEAEVVDLRRRIAATRWRPRLCPVLRP
jgi:hypothetical protein